MIFAVSGVTPEWGWQAICFILAGIAVTAQVLGMVRGGRAQKREVSFTEQYATKAEVQAVDSKVEILKADIVRNGETRRAAIEQKVEVARQEARHDTAELHKKVNDLAKEVASGNAQTEMINQNLQLLTAEVRRAPLGRAGI